MTCQSNLQKDEHLYQSSPFSGLENQHEVLIDFYRGKKMLLEIFFSIHLYVHCCPEKQKTLVLKMVSFYLQTPRRKGTRERS